MVVISVESVENFGTKNRRGEQLKHKLGFYNKIQYC